MPPANPDAPFHRRTLDEDCRSCGAAKFAWCSNLLTGKRVIRLHLYRSTEETT